MKLSIKTTVVLEYWGSKATMYHSMKNQSFFFFFFPEKSVLMGIQNKALKISYLINIALVHFLASYPGKQEPGISFILALTCHSPSLTCVRDMPRATEKNVLVFFPSFFFLPFPPSFICPSISERKCRWPSHEKCMPLNDISSRRKRSNLIFTFGGGDGNCHHQGGWLE